MVTYWRPECIQSVRMAGSQGSERRSFAMMIVPPARSFLSLSLKFIQRYRNSQNFNGMGAWVVENVFWP
jgi:hypothetical protein